MAPAGVVTWQDWSGEVRVVTADAAAIGEAERICRATMLAAARAIDRFDPSSELSRLSGHAAGGVPVSADLARFVRVGLDVSAATGGAVDPTVGSDLRRLGYTVDVGSIPPDGSAPVPRPQRRSWHDVHLDAANRTLTMPDDVVLDLGASAKALAADLAAQRIADRLGCGALVSLGGDVSAAGCEPVGGWRVQMRDGAGEPAWLVVLRGPGGIATSSIRHRVWSRGGVVVTHILDPRTGLPVPPTWRTVGVVASTCVQANAWSTAAMVLGPEAPAALREQGRPSVLVPVSGPPVELEGWGSVGRRIG